MTTTVTGIYRDPKAAEQALQRLVAAGFAEASISLVVASTPDHERLVRADTEDTQRGVVTGVVAGGLFASLLVGALSLGVGFLAAGPITAALAAGGAGAAAGGALGALVGHDQSLHSAQEYETAIQHGAVLLAVHTDWAHRSRAAAVLRATGGEMIADAVRLGGGPGEAAAGS